MGFLNPSSVASDDLYFREINGKAERRWFSSQQFDLILWLSEDQGFAGFELCYDKQKKEHSIAWSATYGYRHMAVDTGEWRPGKHKSTPILVPDGYFDLKRIRSDFDHVSHSLPQEIAQYVHQALAQYPQTSA